MCCSLKKYNEFLHVDYLCVRQAPLFQLIILLFISQWMMLDFNIMTGAPELLRSRKKILAKMQVEPHLCARA